MKKILTLIAIALIGLGSIQAQQRYGFIDTDYILGKIPEYNTAQEQLDKLSVQWQNEIEGLFHEVETMQSKYRTDQVFLSAEMREKREKEIAKKEYGAQKLQHKYFGRDGLLYKKRQELVKPIQDDIYKAVREIAKAGSYGMIIDKANGPVVIYSNAKFDLSDKVLYKLGYKK